MEKLDLSHIKNFNDKKFKYLEITKYKAILHFEDGLTMVFNIVCDSFYDDRLNVELFSGEN